MFSLKKKCELVVPSLDLIHPETDKIDGGFLRRAKEFLIEKESLKSFEEMVDCLEKFYKGSHRVMPYHFCTHEPEKKGWYPHNFAYNNVAFLPEGNCLVGNCYNLPHSGGNSRNGKILSFLRLEEKKRTLLTTLALKDDYEFCPGIIFAKEIENNRGTYWIDLFIGDYFENRKLQMPKFESLGKSS